MKNKRSKIQIKKYDEEINEEEEIEFIGGWERDIILYFQ